MARDKTIQEQIETDLYLTFGGGPTGQAAEIVYTMYVKPLEDELKEVNFRIDSLEK